MPRSLVIVESPAKARTIAGFLGRDFIVKASMGHVRDLPAKGLSVDTENGFKVDYEVNANKKQVIKELRDALRDADELYLATDEDREGEAISWHLLEVLKPRVPVKRMVFHEITEHAIADAVDQWREVDYGLVDAQESRRIVDRLFGYPVSEVCWRKIRTGLSAGRVQSPSVRLVVQRERERMAFVAAAYWDLEAAFPTDPNFTASLVAVDGAKVAEGKDFDSVGQPKRTADLLVLDEAGRARSGRPPRRRRVHGAERRHEAVHVETEASVHHVVTPAGRRKPTAHERAAGDARRARPLRARLHHLHAYGLDDAGRHRARRGTGADPRAVRLGVPPRPAAHVREEVQERAGGPRGHSPRGRGVADAGAAARRAARRRPAPLRADLAAHDRVADARRTRVDGHRATRGHDIGRRTDRVDRVGPHHHVPRLPRGLRVRR